MGGNRKSQRKINNTGAPKPQKSINRGLDPNQSKSPLTFNLSRKEWLKSVSSQKFTNKLSDETMFSGYLFELFHKLIPTLQENWQDIIKKHGRGNWKHCHPVEEDKLDFVLGIIEQVHGHTFRDEESVGPSIWQFGFTQSLRLIAIYDYVTNSLTPVFIDYHHLLHPDKNYNQRDYLKYNFCPVCEYNK